MDQKLENRVVVTNAMKRACLWCYHERAMGKMGVDSWPLAVCSIESVKLAEKAGLIEVVEKRPGPIAREGQYTEVYDITPAGRALIKGIKKCPE